MKTILIISGIILFGIMINILSQPSLADLTDITNQIVEENNKVMELIQ